MTQTTQTPIGADLIGQYVLVRTFSAGVHVGTLESREGREVLLSDTRRIWYWDGAASLSELSERGPSKPKTCKFPAATPRILLTEAIEILPVSEVARQRIAEVAPWTA